VRLEDGEGEGGDKGEDGGEGEGGVGVCMLLRHY